CKNFLRLDQRAMINLVLAKVIRKILPLMFDVETRLADGVKPDDQLRQARGTRHEHDLFVGKPLHFRAGCAVSNSRRRSGEMLSWPILSAFMASSWKAKAISCSGFMPVLARACRIFASAVLRAFMVLATP